MTDVLTVAEMKNPPRARQREDVDAAMRTVPGIDGPDPRGIAIATTVAADLVSRFGDSVLAWSVARDEVTVDVRSDEIVRVAEWMRDSAGFALLSNLAPTDWLGAPADGSPPLATQFRFSVSYIFTKCVTGAPRVRARVWVNEDEPVPSVMAIYPTADWHEREGFDLFGIRFTGREGLRRILMNDDWVGHPLRKDYPLGGEPAKFTNSLREV